MIISGDSKCQIQERGQSDVNSFHESLFKHSYSKRIKEISCFSLEFPELDYSTSKITENTETNSIFSLISEQTHQKILN